MKIQPVLSIKKIVFSLFFGSVILSGCVITKPFQPLAPDAEISFEYQSELADPNAKALFAFSEFRLLGAKNRWEEAIAALERAITFDPQSNYLQLLLSKIYLHREQPERAAVVLKSLLTRSPESVKGHELLGDVFSYQQNYVSAIEHFRRALQLAPDSEMLQMRLAMALARLERKDEAIAVLEMLLEKHPEAGFARLSLARFYLEKNQTEKASMAYQQLLDREPGKLQAVLEYGKLLERQDPDAALEFYQAAIAHNPRTAAVRQQLAQFYFVHRRFHDALEQFQAVHQQFPGNLQIIGRIGLIQLKLEKWTEAEETFRLLLETDNHQGYFLAMALLGQGKFAEAIDVLEPITCASPMYTEAALQLAYLYKQFNQDARAISTLRQVIDRDIHHPDVYYYLAAFLDDQGDYKQARDVAFAGVEKNQKEVRLLYQLGVLYEKLKDHQAAVQTMEQILLLNDAHPDALNFLAYYQAEKEIDLELALSRAQKALVIKPSGYIVDTLGWIYFKMGRYPESREQLEKATKMHPDDAVILEHLGDLYRAMKLWKKAAVTYQRVLEIDPRAETAEEKLKALPLEME